MSLNTLSIMRREGLQSFLQNYRESGKAKEEKKPFPYVEANTIIIDEIL